MKTTTTTIATNQPSANPRHSSITHTAIRRCQSAPATVLALLAALLTLWADPAAHAAALTWDTATGDGVAISAGSGLWNTTAGNLVWNDGTTPNVIWSQPSATAGLNTATFGGSDGAVNSYAITVVAGGIAAQSITFNNTGYLISGGALAPINGAANGTITVAAGKSATINSTLRYIHNVGATVTVNSGSVLSLGGGTTASYNPQFTFSGAGTINLTGGTFTQNIGNINNAVINLTGGTHAVTPGNNGGANIGNNAGQSVNYTVSGTGTLTVNGNNTTATVLNSYLALGKAAGNTAYQNTLTVQNGTVNIGTTASRAGELRIASDAVSSGKLDVQGGTVTIGTGDTANKIYFFKGGPGSGYTATITQSGGTVTANGRQFRDTTGTYDAASSATLQLSGGNLYVGAQGITLGSAASGLPVTIQLQGGTLGADQNWSSSLDVKLGTTGGGPTIRA